MEKRAHNYKPRPKFFGAGDVYLGLELEVEAPDYEKERQGLTEAGEPNWCYAKRDGSLGPNGVEFVTHPISMSSWMTQQDVADYRNIPVGTVLTARYKGAVYTATARDGGRFEWNGSTYPSLTKTAQAICGGNAPSPYKFFGLTKQTANSATVATSGFFRLVASLRTLGYDSHDGGRCGFHIHVSCKAFSEDGTINNPTFYRFKCLVNGSLFAKLSQRTGPDAFRFCQQEPVDRYNYTFCRTRYSAVNITEKTIEVRIFRGNLREERLRKNIEGVIAAIEFSKLPGTSEIFALTPPTDEQFIAYVNQNADKYPNLLAYINRVSEVNMTITEATEGSDA